MVALAEQAKIVLLVVHNMVIHLRQVCLELPEARETMVRCEGQQEEELSILTYREHCGIMELLLQMVKIRKTQQTTAAAQGQEEVYGLIPQIIMEQERF